MELTTLAPYKLHFFYYLLKLKLKYKGHLFHYKSNH
nr:MAG TPA: hypothetical protein [Caudoviricetes sp.]